VNDNNTIILGVIPARGGSKGIKGKNLIPVFGKPLIAYAIECGKKCPSIDRLIVSTDSPEIAEISSKYGAEIPFIRPAELANDTAPMLPVLQHAIIKCEKYYSKVVEAVILLDPTGPLRTVEDIENSLEILRQKECNAIISGNTAHRNPYFNMVTLNKGYVVLANPSGKMIGRRQDAPKVFDLNTVVWVYSRKALMEEKARIPKRTILYMIPPERAIDIDNEFDLKLLEFQLQQNILYKK